MDRQPLRPFSPNRTADEVEAEALEGRIVAVLEGVPSVRIPMDFAARVTSRLPACSPHTPVSLPPTRVGFGVTVAALVLLLVGMVLVASRAGGPQPLLWTTLEWTLSVQFCALAVWLTVFYRQPD
ncbi:MAG: hypothetical protein M3O02_06580 [Acidobacteriota bacterium]|nr:hypothetical protein [Acidobacteriota bacterium]